MFVVKVVSLNCPLPCNHQTKREVKELLPSKLVASSAVETPVPISNTAVKHCYGDDSRFQLGPAKVARRQFIVEEFLFLNFFSARVKIPCADFALYLGLARFALQNSMPARPPMGASKVENKNFVTVDIIRIFS